MAQITKIGDIFPTTSWNLVAKAHASQTRIRSKALGELCQTYWLPIYTFARGRGYSRADAEDLTQGFFGKLFEYDSLDSVDPSKGKLRSFLLASFKNYLGTMGEHSRAWKRGGREQVVSLDSELAENRFVDLVDKEATPEAAFDRQWTITLLAMATEKLRASCEAAGKLELFDVLKDFLDASREPSYEEAAERLGISIGATRTAVHRMRQDFRTLFRREVADTLVEGADLGEEVRYLLGLDR